MNIRVASWAVLSRHRYDEILDIGKVSPEIRSKYGLDAGSSILMVTAPYGGGCTDIPPAISLLHRQYPGPSVTIGAFAQADWYAALRLGLTRIAISLEACSTKLEFPGTGTVLETGMPRQAIRDSSPEEPPGNPADFLADQSARPVPCTQAAFHDPAPDTGFRPGAAFRRTWRVLTNSMLPERALAFAVGLGTRGRSHLLMAGNAGPAVLLGILVTPLDAELLFECTARVVGLETSVSIRDRIDLADVRMKRTEPGHACGSCTACVDACPTKALGMDGRFSRLLCLQHWTTVPGPIPEGIRHQWGSILYGCDICTSVCPRRMDPVPMCETPPGILGPSLPARWLTDTPAQELKTALRGTTLGLNRIPVELLVRNARLVAGMHQGQDCRPNGQAGVPRHGSGECEGEGKGKDEGEGLLRGTAVHPPVSGKPT